MAAPPSLLPQAVQVLDRNGMFRRVWYQLLEAIFRRIRWQLEPTNDVKVAAYTAKPWEMVLFNPTAGTFAVNLPEAPTDGTCVGLANVTDDATGVTPTPQGDDTELGGAGTLFTGTRADPALILCYDASRADWVRH